MAFDRPWIRWVSLTASAVALLSFGGREFQRWRTRPGPGRMRDEARLAGRGAFAAPDEDYFHDVDGKLDLALDEIQGRNTWMVWSAGNDRFWDWLARESGGSFDLLKIVGSYDPEKDSSATPEQREKLKQTYRFRRENRLAYLGVLNEPCYDQAQYADPRRYGLWLDRRQVNCAPDPFENDEKYRGVPSGARGKNMPLGSVYGEPSGVLGLRLFPNPDFRGPAVVRWDPVRYYTDPSYFGSRELVRPYRVGMTCAFCHAGLNPAKLPDDLEDPQWENVSSTVGAQYMRMERVALWQGDPSQFLWQLLHASRPGSMDTSLIATDQINNPRAASAFFQTAARMKLARQWGKEKLAGASLENREMSSYVAGGPLAAFFEEPATVWTPRMGQDAMDSVGILGAVNRAFSELGMFSEEWLLHFSPLVGGKPQIPMDIKQARMNSGYWQATEDLSPNVVRFLMRMADAPKHAESSGDPFPDRPRNERTAAARGKLVFAERCASCHSSRFPAPPADADPGNCSGNYLDCWNRYWAWTKTDAYRQQMGKTVVADDFLNNNFLSTDLRVPLPLVGTNACIALSSNGTAGNLWSAFTSETYQNLPSAGSITYYHPETGEKRERQLPAGGRGYLRPPSLVGLWYTAPYLNNNSVGRFEASPAKEARLAAFRDGLEQLLWPERREKDEKLGDRIPGRIERTTAVSRLRVPARMMPAELAGVLEAPSSFFGGTAQGIEIGPIPAGTPVSLLANLDLLSEKAVPLLLRMKRELKSEENFTKFVDPLLELSTCPDFVVNRGHYFGTGLDGESALTDRQKRDLIEFLKMM
jgi:mono/diheme cytochrome c family protein